MTSSAAKAGPQAAEYRGLAIVHMREYVVEKFGDAAATTLSSKLDVEAARAFDSPVAFDWYPLRVATAIERAIVEQLYGGDLTGAQMVGAFDAERQLGRAFRFLLSHLEPENFFKRGERIMSQVVRGPGVSFAFQEDHPRQWTIRIGGYDPIDEVHCHDFLGTVRLVLTLCKTQDPLVEHPQCRLRGAPECVFVASWL